MDFGSKAIAFSGNGAEEARILGIVFESLAGFADSSIVAVVSINKDAFTPDSQQDFLTCDETVAVLGEQEEQLQGNAFEFDDMARAAQLEGAWVELEVFESNGLVGNMGHTLVGTCTSGNDKRALHHWVKRVSHTQPPEF